MKKEQYKAPRTKVVAIAQNNIICASPGFGTEQLEEENFEW